ncbi:glycine zipper family protein [Marivivens donghaensis]|uniref:Glycine zipper family protein n=1 Tax=Marivivens donghaensis TaxID=1699413 RepID=A0ABX0W001_9RHOB|nr:glycine zipper family protein [Marivivens donghaensis]NIY73672.1 glycine zipper family protein [Marivivens donghaensis]
MKKTVIAVLVSCVFVAACAEDGSLYTPVVDGVPAANFNTDLAACQALAQNQRHLDQETMAAAAMGAGAGALLGHWDDDADAAGGAVAGALAGGIAGAVDATDTRKAIVIACMRGRGHKVVA